MGKSSLGRLRNSLLLVVRAILRRAWWVEASRATTSCHGLLSKGLESQIVRCELADGLTFGGRESQFVGVVSLVDETSAETSDVQVCAILV